MQDKPRRFARLDTQNESAEREEAMTDTTPASAIDHIAYAKAQAERAAFEDWLDTSKIEGTVRELHVSWAAWQARAALEREVMKP